MAYSEMTKDVVARLKRSGFNRSDYRLTDTDSDYNYPQIILKCSLEYARSRAQELVDNGFWLREVVKIKNRPGSSKYTCTQFDIYHKFTRQYDNYDYRNDGVVSETCRYVVMVIETKYGETRPVVEVSFHDGTTAFGAEWAKRRSFRDWMLLYGEKAAHKNGLLTIREATAALEAAKRRMEAAGMERRMNGNDLPKKYERLAHLSQVLSGLREEYAAIERHLDHIADMMDEVQRTLDENNSWKVHEAAHQKTGKDSGSYLYYHNGNQLLLSRDEYGVWNISDGGDIIDWDLFTFEQALEQAAKYGTAVRE